MNNRLYDRLNPPMQMKLYELAKEVLELRKRVEELEAKIKDKDVVHSY